jgi:cell division protein FtsL
MRREKQLSEQLFRAVCLGFSAILLVMTLFGQIRLVKTESRIESLVNAIADAENERVVLQIRLNEALPLEELERRAVQELGMRHPEPGQIVTIDYME